MNMILCLFFLLIMKILSNFQQIWALAFNSDFKFF